MGARWSSGFSTTGRNEIREVMPDVQPYSQVDPDLPFLAAWIKQESGGKPTATGKDGERGLLQIMPSTARAYGITDPDLLYNPKINIAIAKRYYTDLLKKYNGSQTLALMAYNDGPGNVDKWLKGQHELPASTKRYALNVLQGSQPAMQIPANMASPIVRNLPYAKPGPYITQLKPDQQVAFQQWVKANNVPYNPSAAADYDMPGYWRDVASKGRTETAINPVDQRLHFPDTYKTPSHQSFSAESRYATPDNPFKWRGETLLDTRTDQPIYQTPFAPQQQGFLQRLGVEGVAEAAEPGEYTGPILSAPPKSAATPKEPEYTGPVLNKPPTKPEPWPARVAEWAPFVGQIAGETGAGLLAVPAAAAAATVPIVGPALGLGTEAAVIGAGGGLGAGGGEEIREAVRRHYGLPVTPQVESAALWGAGTSAAGVPVSKVIGLLPGFRTAKGAAQGFEESTQAATALKGTVEEATKLPADKAAALRSAQEATERAVRSVTGIEKSVRERLGQSYEATLSPFGHRVTPGESRDVLGQLSISLRKTVLNEAQRMFPQNNVASYLRYPTVRRVQEMRTAARAVASSMNEDTQRLELAAMRRYISALTKDLEAGLPVMAAKSLRTLDKLYAQHGIEMPGSMMGRVRAARSMAEVGDIIKKPESLNVLIREAERIPDKMQQALALQGVRDSVSTALQSAAAKGSSEPQRLGNLMNFIRNIPDETFKRLYGTNKRELLELGQETRLMHDKMLRNPNLRIAIDRALQDYKKETGHILRYMQHHIIWTTMGASIGGLGGYERGGAGEALAGGFIGLFGAMTLAKIARSPVAMGFYKRAVTGTGTPEEIAKALRATFAAIIAQEAGRQEDVNAAVR